MFVEHTNKKVGACKKLNTCYDFFLIAMIFLSCVLLTDLVTMSTEYSSATLMKHGDLDKSNTRDKSLEKYFDINSLSVSYICVASY